MKGRVMGIDLKRELYAQGQLDNYVGDLTARAVKRIEQLERALIGEKIRAMLTEKAAG